MPSDGAGILFLYVAMMHSSYVQQVYKVRCPIFLASVLFDSSCRGNLLDTQPKRNVRYASKSPFVSALWVSSLGTAKHRNDPVPAIPLGKNKPILKPIPLPMHYNSILYRERGKVNSRVGSKGFWRLMKQLRGRKKASGFRLASFLDSSGHFVKGRASFFYSFALSILPDFVCHHGPFRRRIQTLTSEDFHRLFVSWLGGEGLGLLHHL